LRGLDARSTLRTYRGVNQAVMASWPITPAAVSEGFTVGMEGADRHGYSIAQTVPVSKPARLNPVSLNQPIARPVTRRSVLVGFATLVTASAIMLALPGCGRKTGNEGPIDIMGDRREPGDPLWLPESQAWILAETSGGTDLIAVSGLCPYEKRVVGWCTETDSFTCPICQSTYDRTGAKYAGSGPAQRGLSQFGLEVSDDQSVIVNRTVTTDGKIRTGEWPTVCGLGEPKLVIPDTVQRPEK
jgi:hypothetical protein